MSFRNKLKEVCPGFAHLSESISSDEELALEMLSCMGLSVQNANSRAAASEKVANDYWRRGYDFAKSTQGPP